MTKKNTLGTTWNLTVLYKNTKDPHILKDIARFEEAISRFEKKYKTTIQNFQKPAFLRVALTEYEKLSAMPEASRAGYYFGLRRELNAKDDEAEKLLNVLSDRLTKAGNKLLFFELALGKLPFPVQKKLLRDTTLTKFHYYLHNLFEEAKHHLSEPEEKILNLKGNTSYGLWVAGTEKILNRKSITWKGKKVPVAEAFELIARLPKTDRRKLWALCIEVLKSLGEVAENEVTAIMLDKKVNDELRGFSKPYSATLLGNENSESSIEALIAAVKRNYGIAHRFYRLKAKMLGLKKLTYADRSATIGNEPKISFNDATATLREVFHNVNPLYGNILDDMLEKRQIDVYPKSGKTGGAFCASLENLPTYVLLNYVPSTRSLMTYAHEMGHAIHAERSKLQPSVYQGHSTAVAETASTLFEQLVFDANLKLLTKKEKIVALHDQIQDAMSSIVRQVAFFDFEHELHLMVRKNGAVNENELAALMQKHLKAYLGPAVEVTRDDGYSFVYISHFRRFFYVYTYAYGNLISNAIAEKFKADKNFRKQIDQFLIAGCSKSPEEIFNAIGIDTTKPTFFELGLKKLSERIDELEALL